MPNPILLKVATLLAEFFQANQRLDLPGIGSFTLPAGADPDQASFEANPGLRESPALVDFIASTTGKIKALAAADLDSHLELARQFLNIGKPFLFEGIGSLVKQQTGNYSFTPGAPVTEKANPRATREQSGSESSGSSMEGFKSIFYAPPVKTNHRKVIFIFLLVAGMGMAIWGGYSIYKKTTRKDTVTASKESGTAEPENEPAVQTALTETAPANISTATDTTRLVNQPPAIAPPGNYKFIVETADKTRGLARFSRLKGFGLDIHMETRDSVSFKLYFIIPALASDTTRLLDSLKRLYTPAGNMAYIEK